MGLCVSDLAASLAFYRDVAGFTVQSGPYQLVGEWFDTLTWNEGAEIEVAMLELDGFTIQLVQYHAAGDDAGAARAQPRRQPAPVHQRRGRRRRSTPRSLATGEHRPTVIVDIAGTGYRSFYVDDPDGTPVEFIQAP